MIAPRNESYPTQEHTTWVLYDLQDPEAFEQARRDRKAWGREYTTLYSMGLDHVLVVFCLGRAESRTANAKRAEEEDVKG